MDGAIARIDDTPTALGTRLAHGGTCVRHLVAGAERVRRAVKPIGRCYRPNLDGFEQNVVSGISTHAGRISIVVVLYRETECITPNCIKCS